MSTFDDNAEISEDENEEIEVDESEEEETYIKTLTRQVVSEYEDRIADYVDDPATPEETAKNESIKKFLVQKVRNKLLESFEDQLQWIDDADLVSMVRKWKKLTATNDELDASTAMKRIIKENVSITEVVEQQLDEMLEDAEETEDEDS